jgi:DNA-binding response OmpR family regulator
MLEANTMIFGAGSNTQSRNTGVMAMRIPIMAARLHELKLYTHWLASAGHSVEPFKHPRPLLGAVSCNQFDTLLLDGDGSAMSGVALIRELRLITPIPALIVSRDETEEGVVSSLRAGADDYLVKPVRRNELLARLESITRQREQPKHGRLDIGGLRVDFLSRTISFERADTELRGPSKRFSAG